MTAVRLGLFNAIRSLAWQVDGWVMLRALFISLMAGVGIILLAPTNTLALPTWVYMARLMCETCWGVGALGIAVLAALGPLLGAWVRIVGSYLLAVGFMGLGVLGVAATPHALIPWVFIITAGFSFLSALRTAARNAKLAMPHHGD